jgi:hypothetical protein
MANRKGGITCATIRKENIANITEHERLEFWTRKSGTRSGVYIYFATQPVNYPFGRSKIVYIGKSDNLAKRLTRHFGMDSKKKLLYDGRSLSWFFQNYFVEGKLDRIHWSYFQKPREMERLLIGLFAGQFGVPPLCNARIERKSLPTTFDHYRAKKRLIQKLRRIVGA